MLYNRVLIKMSGEALANTETKEILSHAKLAKMAQQVKDLHANGLQIAVVVGAGNIFRGKLAGKLGIERASADYMGMLGTIINAVALQSILGEYGMEARVMSSIEVKAVSEPYIQKRAIRHLEKGVVVILAGGTGNPYFTTDTTASLRAMELDVDAILMAKNGVDGVYDSDPTKNKKAKFIKTLTFQDVIDQDLKVMDQTAVTLLQNNDAIIIHVFDMDQENVFINLVNGKQIGTIIKKGK